ncbi:gamma-glutamyl-gamma-aminobutyrate hydrolase family protein [soil metagenome]
MRPVIAVTTTLAFGGRRNLPQITLNAQYLTAIESAGGASLPITPAHDPASVPRLVGLCDGLVLTGGEDIDPARYGQAPHPKTGKPNTARDEIEFAALDAALDFGLPVLAICRGMQVLNVALGGTLFQDLPSQLPGGISHDQDAPIGERWHAARVLEGSGLQRVLGASELFINSFHHQGVDRLGRGLRPTVWTEDGLVEGVEGERGWVKGVQWHPERGEASTRLDEKDPDRRLFREFVRASRAAAIGFGGPRQAAREPSSPSAIASGRTET